MSDINKYKIFLESISKIDNKIDQLKFLVENRLKNYNVILAKPEFKYLLDFINDNVPECIKSKKFKLNTKIYWILHNIVKFPVCKQCGKPLTDNIKNISIGYDNYLCSKICKNKSRCEKIKNTCLKKYGCENVFQLENIKTKIAEKNILKYGNKCPANNKDIREKIKKDNVKKYGFEYFQSTEEYVDKVKKTCLEKYNVDNYSKTKEFKERASQTLLQKVGYTTMFLVPEVKERSKKSLIEKYGNDYMKVISKNAVIAHYKRAYSYMLKSSKIVPMFTLEEYISLRQQGVNSFQFKCKKCKTLFFSNWDDGKTSNICPECKKNILSFEEKILQKFILHYFNSTDILFNTKAIIDSNLELDIYIPEKKLAIEFDGLYWHSTYLRKDKNYHLTKTKLCEKQGIQLVHIFENEWLYSRQIVKSRLKSLFGIYDKIIYARKCSIKEIDNEISRNFLDENHIQGKINSKINIGLYLENELVSLMTFSKPRFSKKYEYEMIRFCSKINYNVIGAAGKMLKYFEKTYQPKSIVSYADRRWSVGNLYKKLGFNLENISEPNYWYFKDSILENRIKFQKHKLKNILEKFDENLSEYENMKNNGYYRIFDCGNLVFVKKY